MLYRVDTLQESSINPITGKEYDPRWIVLMLTDSDDYRFMCGSQNGCAYTVKVSRRQCENWALAVGDFVGFHTAGDKEMILVLSQSDWEEARRLYRGHSYNEPQLRPDEPQVLIHSTSMQSWQKIRQDGMLKCWNRLKREQRIAEEQPIGAQLGDAKDFSDYIMFGGGVTGEIVVNSRQKGKIVMDLDDEYLAGARLYFDAEKMAANGLLVRDGCHVKVREALPLSPYLIWAATWEEVGLPAQVSTPRIFAEQADRAFAARYSAYSFQ